MPTLLLSPRNIPDFEPLTAAAKVEGWSVLRLPGWRIERAPADEHLAVYGEPLFVAAVAQQLSLVLLEPPFDWLSRLPRKYLQRVVTSATLGALDAAAFPAFIKPADDKCFPAQVYASLADFPTGEHLSLATPIIISEPVEWELEFRCFVAERRCTGLSIYERAGELAQAPDGSWPAAGGETSQAQAFIDQLLADRAIPLPPAVVVDIGRIPGKGWAVIEANPAWGAGIYGCEPRGALHAIARGCRTAQDLTLEDKKWIVERTTGEPQA